MPVPCFLFDLWCLFWFVLPVPEHILLSNLVHLFCFVMFCYVFCFVCVPAALPDCNVYWLYPSPAFPFHAADYGGSALLHTAHHTIITTDHGCRHPNLLTDSQAVIVCCTLQVSYGLVGVVGIGRKYSKPLVCISTLLHHYRTCHTATHTCTPHVWRSCPTEVSIPHGESFLALGFDYPLFYSLQSRHRYPTQLQDS